MTTTRLPKARVRVAVWVDPAAERFRALVLVTGAKPAWISTPEAELLTELIEDVVEQQVGNNWEFVTAINLGRLINPRRRDVARALEDAA